MSPLLAHRVIRRDALFWSLTAHSGQWREPALNWSVAIDPTATFPVHCRNDFAAGFSPYQSTRLSRYNAAPELGVSHAATRVHHASRQCGDCVAIGGAGTACGKADPTRLPASWFTDQCVRSVTG